MADIPIPRVLAALLLGSIAGFIALRLGLLSRSGAAAAGVVGFVLFAVGSWPWALPILTFFLTSSIISRLNYRFGTDLSGRIAKGGARDGLQVLANGGIGALLSVLWWLVPDERLYLTYLGSVAAATADTWGTEAGTLLGGRPVLVTTFQPVEKGTSGGISLAGLSAGFAGVLVIILSAMWWVERDITMVVGVIFVAGMAGSLIDSILGATLQRQYRCGTCEMTTEREDHCGGMAVPVRGVRWMTNDAVNVACTGTGAILGFALS